MYPLKLKTEIYQAIAVFLDAYKRQDTQTLAEQFDIHGEVLEEIDDMLDFIEDKTKLYLVPLEEVDKFEYGITGLSMEAKLYEEGEAQHIGYIVGEYFLNGQKPAFMFQYFSV